MCASLLDTSVSAKESQSRSGDENPDLWIKRCLASQNSGGKEKGFVLSPTSSISMGAHDDLGEMRTATTSNRG